MKFKLLIALVTDNKTETVTDTGRSEGATGCTVITAARGEGLNPPKTFLGLTLEGQRDVVLLLVEEHLSQRILEAIGKACRFDEEPGTGIAFQIDVEDAVGLKHQIDNLHNTIEEEL